LAQLDDAIYAKAEEFQPATLRQIYYGLVSGGVIEKTEEAYHLVGRQLVKLRKSGDLPYGWIADNTRWQRKPNTYSDLETMLRRISRFYRRQLWDNQDAYVEIWLEKDALSGVLYDVTREFDVPLMVTRGYPSLTFMHSAADKINEINKPTHIYYFGDHDPSGVDIPRKVRQTLEEFDCEFEFECVAVTPDQISSMNLLTRPTKKSDSRSKGFEGESVEVDAIHPDDLRALVRDCITQHIDKRALMVTQEAERSEREIMTSLADRVEKTGVRSLQDYLRTDGG
jgi:hypothetical protein